MNILILTTYLNDVSLFSKHFAIKKISTNLLDLKLHYGYAVALVVGTVLVDQGKHILLEIFYWRLGPDAAFHIWILVFLLENLGRYSISICYEMQKWNVICT